MGPKAKSECNIVRPETRRGWGRAELTIRRSFLGEPDLRISHLGFYEHP